MHSETSKLTLRVGGVARSSLQRVTQSAARMNQGRNSATECQKAQWVNSVHPIPKGRQDLMLCGVGSAALTAVRCRRSCAGIPPKSLNGEEGGDFRLIAITLASFRAGGHDRDGSREAVFAWALAEDGRPGFGGWVKVVGRAVAIRVQSQVLSGEASASSSGLLLTSPTKRGRSRSPCGVRMRDKCTKRESGRRAEECNASPRAGNLH